MKSIKGRATWGGGGLALRIGGMGVQSQAVVYRIQTHSNKVCVLGISDSDDGVDFFNQLLFLVILKVHVPLGQARLTGTVLNQDETNLHKQ